MTPATAGTGGAASGVGRWPRLRRVIRYAWGRLPWVGTLAILCAFGVMSVPSVALGEGASSTARAVASRHPISPSVAAPCPAGHGVRDLRPGDWYHRAACQVLDQGIVHTVRRGNPDPPWLLPQLRLNVADWAHWLARAFPSAGGGLPATAPRLPCLARGDPAALPVLRQTASLLRDFSALSPVHAGCLASDFVTRVQAVDSLVIALGCQTLRLPAPSGRVLTRFADVNRVGPRAAHILAIATLLQPPLLVGIPMAAPTGHPGLALDPHGILTRAQGVTLIYRAERIPPCSPVGRLRAAAWHPWT